MGFGGEGVRIPAFDHGVDGFYLASLVVVFLFHPGVVCLVERGEDAVFEEGSYPHQSQGVADVLVVITLIAGQHVDGKVLECFFDQRQDDFGVVTTGGGDVDAQYQQGVCIHEEGHFHRLQRDLAPPYVVFAAMAAVEAGGINRSPPARRQQVAR